MSKQNDVINIVEEVFVLWAIFRNFQKYFTLDNKLALQDRVRKDLRLTVFKCGSGYQLKVSFYKALPNGSGDAGEGLDVVFPDLITDELSPLNVQIPMNAFLKLDKEVIMGALIAKIGEIKIIHTPMDEVEVILEIPSLSFEIVGNINQVEGWEEYFQLKSLV